MVYVYMVYVYMVYVYMVHVYMVYVYVVYVYMDFILFQLHVCIYTWVSMICYNNVSSWFERHVNHL